MFLQCLNIHIVKRFLALLLLVMVDCEKNLHLKTQRDFLCLLSAVQRSAESLWLSAALGSVAMRQKVALISRPVVLFCRFPTRHAKRLRMEQEPCTALSPPALAQLFSQPAPYVQNVQEQHKVAIWAPNLQTIQCSSNGDIAASIWGTVVLY